MTIRMSHRLAGLSGRLVLDVVVSTPKTLGRHATAAQAVAAFQDDHVHMLLITDDVGRLLGTLVRDDLAGVPADAGAALVHARLHGRTMPPDVPAERALDLLLRRGERRRAVVDGNGRLLGLLCLNRRLTRFCSDDDVRARAADAAGR